MTKETEFHEVDNRQIVTEWFDQEMMPNLNDAASDVTTVVGYITTSVVMAHQSLADWQKSYMNLIRFMLEEGMIGCDEVAEMFNKQITG